MSTPIGDRTAGPLTGDQSQELGPKSKAFKRSPSAVRAKARQGGRREHRGWGGVLESGTILCDWPEMLRALQARKPHETGGAGKRAPSTTTWDMDQMRSVFRGRDGGQTP